MPGQDRVTSFPVKKLALYDLATAKYAGLGMKNTGDILKSLKIPHKLITDFNALSDYEVLIIGANSIDSIFLQSGDKINSWIRNGGRIVMFEQNTGTALPWINDEKILIMGKSSFMEIYYKKHPVFAGIEDEMAWESPAGNNGAIFDTCLELNDGFLAVAAASHYQDTKAIKSIINNRKLGKGEYFISMVATADRYGIDGTITGYVENVLKYILSDTISPYAVESREMDAAAVKIISLEKNEAEYIDLRSSVNQGFSDEIAGDRKGGWTDFGKDADMRNIPAGISMLSGMVPFNIINPAENSGRACLVLAGPGRDYFPARSPEIKINNKMEKLFFLHTLMYAKAAEGETMLEYEIIFESGKKITIPMKNKIDIADWWKTAPGKNMQVVFRDGNKCVMAGEWENPSPLDTIVSLKAISKGNCIPIIIAITGKKKFSQTIDRVELGENRK